MEILNNNGSIMKAEDAKQIALTSYCFANRLDKAIREASKENVCTLNWDISEIEQSVVNQVVEQLVERGYYVKFSDENTCLLIKWGTPCAPDMF